MKLLHALMIASLGLGLVACDKKDDAEKPATKTEKAAKTPAKEPAKKAAPKVEAPKVPAAAKLEMAPLEITGDEFAATMNAPKGATAKDSFGTLEVKLGDGKDFFVQIDTDAPDMAAVKKSINENDMQKLQKFHTEAADVFIYETKAFGKTSFWLDSAIKVGDKTVHCYSGRGAPSFTKAHIDTFLAACKSLKPKG